MVICLEKYHNDIKGNWQEYRCIGDYGSHEEAYEPVLLYHVIEKAWV